MGVLDRFKSSFESYDRRVWVLFISQLIVAIGFSVVMPFLAIYLHDRLGVAMSLVGAVFLVGAVMAALGQLIGGTLADRWGRRRVMVVSVSSRGAAFVLVSIAIAGAEGFLLISILVIISFFLGSMFDPAANAMIADVVEKGKRLEAFGLLRVGTNIGWALGPMLGGFLAAISYSTLFLLTAFTSGVSAVLIFLMISESLRKEAVDTVLGKGFASVFKNRNFTLLCITTFILFIVVSQMSSTLSVFANQAIGLMEVEIGYLYSINGAMVAIFQVPLARFLGRYKISRVLTMGAIIYTIGYFLVGLAPAFFFLAICMIIITTGELIVSPSSMNLVANLSPESERGKYMGTFGLSLASGWSMGPFVGGLLIDTMIDVPVLLWGVISIFGLVAAVGYTILGGQDLPRKKCGRIARMKIVNILPLHLFKDEDHRGDD